MTAIAVGVFVVAYVLIATERVHKLLAALGGAGVLLALGVTDSEHAFYSHETGVDWDVVFLLFGMMVIVGVLRRTGVFEYVAIWAAKRAKGSPLRVMILLTLITAVASAFLDNVTTVLLIAPVTLLVCDRLGVNPVPFLIAEVMASNIGGTATLIGDPPNIIIASRGDLSFDDFLINMGPIVVVLLAALVLLSRWLFRAAFRTEPERVQRVMSLNEREALRDRGLLIKALIVVGLVLTGFLSHAVIQLQPSVVALLGAGLLIVLSRPSTRQIFGDVEWETLLFFAGLFIMVGSLVGLGVIRSVGAAATDAIQGHYLLGALALTVGSAVLSGIVDNIPYVATMAPLTADLVNAGGDAARPLWWALTLGADLGGNATAVGASANVVVLGIAERAGHRISFWGFTRYGLIVTVISVALAVPYLWLRFFAFA
jgi:Na+/H+ antiporter NhaD/arsenite permease-like protein